MLGRSPNKPMWRNHEEEMHEFIDPVLYYWIVMELLISKNWKQPNKYLRTQCTFHECNYLPVKFQKTETAQNLEIGRIFLFHIPPIKLQQESA